MNCKFARNLTKATDKLRDKLEKDKNGNLTFDSPRNQRIMKQVLIKALTDSGFITAAIIFGQAWKIGGGEKHN